MSEPQEAPKPLWAVALDEMRSYDGGLRDQTVTLTPKEALAFVEHYLATAARLAEAERERDYQMQGKLDAQVTLQLIVAGLDLTLEELGNGWRASCPMILARIEAIVDEADRAFGERDDQRSRAEAAEARVAELEAVLREDAQAWEADSDGWARACRYFESLPDVDLWDSKELVAALEGRVEAISERRATLAAAAGEPEAATP